MRALGGALGVAGACLVGILVHEFVTAFAAEKLGDKTSRLRGRMSLSLRAHADPLGTFVLPGIWTVAALFGALGGIGIVPFAYGRSHEIEPRAMKNGKAGTIIVSLAGPAATLLLAVLASSASSGFGCTATRSFLDAATYVLVTMTVVELVPLPGRDGGRILQLFLPPRAALKMQEFSEHGAAFVILFLVILGFLASRMVAALLLPVSGGEALCI